MAWTYPQRTSGWELFVTDIKPDTIPVTDLPDASPSDPLEALSWLGDTVEEIAEGLRARGIKGKVTIANACPLANYLRIWFPNPSVWQDISCVDDVGGYYFFADTPRIPFGFAWKFDQGDFPDLIDNG